MKSFALWENDEKNQTKIHVYEPFKKAGDVCVVIFAGGGYHHRALHEGEGYAQLLNAYGFTAAVVDYRVAPDVFPLPLLDARRGVRFMRAHAEEFGIAKDKKNSAAVGIVGKIRNAIENFFLDEKRMEALALSSGSFVLDSGYYEGVEYSYLWRLDEYRNNVKKEEQAEAWDELEKSVIASVADDVIVGVKRRQADIIIVKKFA